MSRRRAFTIIIINEMNTREVLLSILRQRFSLIIGMIMENYRGLTQSEIARLCAQGCFADNWQSIMVAEGFLTQKIRDVEFVAKVRIGSGCELVNAVLKDVEIGDNVRIRSVHRLIDNYIIGDGVVIENVGGIVAGKENVALLRYVAVVVEGGGREVLIHPGLSAQMAYLQAFSGVDGFKAVYYSVVERSLQLQNERYRLAAGVIIRDVVEIKDSVLAEGAVLTGVSLISESFVGGDVGSGAVIKRSIVDRNGYVGAGCILDKCFVADSAVLDYGFSAEGSLFFANSECLRGEGCAVFAGPFTSSHHKATLLLAGIYSFYTAGSGSNFSNHRFKLGPVHQGIIERGSKTGSGSYLIWPSRVAPFTNVIGRHQQAVNTEDFPFSLLLKQGEKSILLPGALLFSCGCERDYMKWQQRDRRSKDSPDIINSEILNPYTVGKIIKAIELLRQMQNGVAPESLVGAEIPRVYCQKAVKRYKAGVDYYLGNVLNRLVEEGYVDAENAPQIPQDSRGTGEWVDIAGAVVPQVLVTELLDDIITGRVGCYSEISRRLQHFDTEYQLHQRNWVLTLIASRFTTPEDLQKLVRNWQDAARFRLELISRDVYKEFADQMAIGYGLLGDPAADFRQVHGLPAANRFLEAVRQETDQIIARADSMLRILGR